MIKGIAERMILTHILVVVSDYECGRIGCNSLIQPCVLIPLHKPQGNA